MGEESKCPAVSSPIEAACAQADQLIGASEVSMALLDQFAKPMYLKTNPKNLSGVVSVAVNQLHEGQDGTTLSNNVSLTAPVCVLGVGRCM